MAVTELDEITETESNIDSVIKFRMQHLVECFLSSLPKRGTKAVKYALQATVN